MSSILFGIFLLLYLIPTWMAISRRKANASAIAALNVLLGWTLIGWVVALVWALTVERPVAHYLPTPPPPMPKIYQGVDRG